MRLASSSRASACWPPASNSGSRTRIPRATRTAHHIASTAQEALEHVRELSRGLFPADVESQGFVAALRRLASTTESLHKIRCSLECDTPIVLANGHVATQLYRIAQEAVTNALRHADARRIAIRLSAAGGTTTLMVIDDGVGIDQQVPNEDSIGLSIMRHRALSVGAALSIVPAPEKGTVVTCTLAGATSR